MAAASKSSKSKALTVTLVKPSDGVKKSVTRFNCDEQGAPLASVYVDNAQLAKIGNPDSIIVAITAG